MLTGIESLWTAMEESTDSNVSPISGWLMRLAIPNLKYPLFAGVELLKLRRALLLKIPSGTVPPRRMWPKCAGLEWKTFAHGSEAYLGVVLADKKYIDVFTALSTDMLRRLQLAHDSTNLADIFLGQIGRWQKFLSMARHELPPEQQRGLWGELRFLSVYVIPNLGEKSVEGWKGSLGAEQDFQYESCALEVKTTLLRQPETVRISSERQLDSSNWKRLYLYVVTLEARTDGEATLPVQVNLTRSALSKDTLASELFEERLLSAGYLDSHEHHYSDTGYKIRNERLYRVKRGFPRIVEQDLHDGVGAVSYSLSVAACQSFMVDYKDFIDFAGRPGKGRLVN